MIQPERVPGLIADLAPYLALVCESQVIDFSTRAQYGVWIKFRLQNPESLIGFANGQRFHLMLIAIGDDDMPAALEGKERLPYKLSQLAGMLCSQEEFRHWVTQTYGEPCHNKDEAAAWVRAACGVESRSHLDTDSVAGDTWRGIMRSYDEHKQQQEGGA